MSFVLRLSLGPLAWLVAVSSLVLGCSDGRVQVRTFSPYVDLAKAYLTEDCNQFDLHIDLPGG